MKVRLRLRSKVPVDLKVKQRAEKVRLPVFGKEATRYFSDGTSDLPGLYPLLQLCVGSCKPVICASEEDGECWGAQRRTSSEFRRWAVGASWQRGNA